MARDEAYREAEAKIEEARRTGATELNLSGMKLTELPESLGQLTQLRNLQLNINRLTALPESLGQLTKLHTLSAHRNQLTSLPASIGQLTDLHTLTLNFNKLNILRDEVTQLRTLKVLHVVGNELRCLPASFGELRAIKTLHLSISQADGRNAFIGVPAQLEYLTRLQSLLLDSCDIHDLPQWFVRLDNLHKLSLERNPLNPELAAAYEQGLDAVKAYLRAKAAGQIVLNEAKLILIGEGEVGKTSLLGALRGDEWVENRPTTHGVEVDIKSLVLEVPDHADTTERQGASRRFRERDGASDRSEDDGDQEDRRLGALPLTQPKQITFNGWDFGGQNIYRHTHQLFFTAPAVYLAVWHPRRGPEQCCVDEWIKMVKHRAYDESRPDERPRILVVATHGGPQERSAYIDEQLLRDEFGDLIVGFYHVDSKTGYGLDELKAAIAAAAASIPSVGRSVPTSWKNMLDALRKRSKNDPYISNDQFLAICRGKGIADELADTYAAILNELGHLIHYRGDAELQDTVILKPDWLSKAISYVLEDQQAKDQNGLVEHNRLSDIWNDPERDEGARYPDELHPVFLKLMERFDLSYRVVRPESESPTSLVAQLVPGGRPEGWEQDWSRQPQTGDAQRTRICRIVDAETGRTTEVEGLLYRLIVRLHRYSLGRRNYFNSRHWKTGMILDDDFNGRAFVEEIAGDVHVTVRAAYPDGFLGHLCAEVRWLVDNFWKGLDCRLSVPCHSPCRGLHELEELVETKKEGISKVRCSVCKKFYEIDSLLVAATPRLPLDVVLAELKKVRAELADIKDGVTTLDTDVRLMIGQANEQFDLLMNALTDEAKEGPRLFSFEPIDPGFWDNPKWIAEKFRLTLWCEHSRLPLPGLTGDKKCGVYEVELTREWIKRSAPLLKVLSTTLSLALPIASSAAKSMMDATAFGAFENQLAFGKTCAEGFLESGQQVGDWITTDDESEMDSGRAIRAHGSTLRELHALLKAKDSANRFGALVRVQNKRREFVWVHPQFADEY